MRFAPLRLAVAALCGWGCAASPLPAAEWTQWRGPERNGVAQETRLPRTWPNERPEPRWRAKIGQGYSSPVLADGRIYIMARGDDDREGCLCLHAGTGEIVWRHAYESSYKPPDPTAGRGPKSTPTIDGDRVYTFGLGGMFHALDARTGQVLWSHDCAAEYWGVKKDPTGEDSWYPACGSAASAMVDGGCVIMPVGGAKAGTFAAFDRETGAIVWSALEDRSSYASPIFAPLAGCRQLIGFTGRRMVGINAADRSLLWDVPFRANFEQTVISPVVWNDLVVIGGEKKPTFAVQVTASDGKFTAKEVWRNADLRGYLTTPVVVGDRAIGVDNRLQRLVCLNLADGATVWTSPAGSLGTYASLVVAGRDLLVLSNDGQLFVLAADSDQFEPHTTWQMSEEGETWSHLAVSGSRLYLKDKEHLVCFDLGPREAGL